VAEELPSASLLLIGDVAGGEHVGSEQSGQGSGVHFVRFHLRLCEEPCLVGVGENDVEAVFLEPVVDLDLQVSGGLRARTKRARGLSHPDAPSSLPQKTFLIPSRVLLRAQVPSHDRDGNSDNLHYYDPVRASSWMDQEKNRRFISHVVRRFTVNYLSLFVL
jgi:hypothetical protein